MSNVKAGDIAYIVGEHSGHPESLNGCIVEVLYASPIGQFQLPDGQLASGYANSWVIKFQSPRKVRLTRATRIALYAGCPDANLRPITPPAGTITTEEISTLYAPREEEVTT